MFGGAADKQKLIPTDQRGPLCNGSTLGGEKFKQLAGIGAEVHRFDPLLMQPGKKLPELADGIVPVFRIKGFSTAPV